MLTINDPLKQLRNRILQTPVKKIVLGSGDALYPLDWIATNVEELDITKMEDFIFLFGAQRVDCFSAEHVWEHLTWWHADQANRNIFTFLKPGGNLRIAVPDGFHPDPEYINYVRPGGIGAGAEDHKELYNYKTLKERLEQKGFTVKLLEYWDEHGQFHYNPWDIEYGKIERSKNFDERNRNGVLRYTSLIIDAIKPG